MWAYIVRNIAQRLVLLFFVSILAHSVIHLAPGEPSQVDPMNPRMKPEDIARIREAFHLDEPLYVQYAYWLRDLATGELKSFKDGQPVLPKIGQRFLNSLPLVHRDHAHRVEPVVPGRHPGGRAARLALRSNDDVAGLHADLDPGVFPVLPRDPGRREYLRMSP